MFTMMNSGRISAGLEGIGVAERAWQQALAYARSRIQGRDAATGADAAIIRHADVRRMLMLMRSRVEAMRALAYWSAAAQDVAAHHPDESKRIRYAAFVDLMTPVVKGWCTEVGLDIAQLGIQIHGGAGYMEETGAIQHVRDLRVSTIYEGTTGIQAQDFVGRKISRDGGRAIRALIAEMGETLEDLRTFAASTHASYGIDARVLHDALFEGVDELSTAVDRLLASKGENDPRTASVGFVSFLHLMGTVCGGWMSAKAACVALRKMKARDSDTFYQSKLVTARFYAEHVMPQAAMHSRIARGDGHSALRIADADL